MALSYAQKFVGGAIALLVLTVVGNAIIVSLAVRTPDGLVDEQYQDHGLRYDERQLQQQNRAGWQIAWEHLPESVGAQAVTVHLKDKLGKPLEGASVSLELFRPTQKGHDQRVPLQEATPGRYQAEVRVPLEGLWEARLDIQHGGITYRHRQRLKAGAGKA